MSSTVDIEVPAPLSDCFIHSAVICVRECCGIDAISTDPALVAEWGREAGRQAIAQATGQLEQLITQTQDRSHNVSSLFLNACTNGEVGRGELLTFLQAFKDALLAYQHVMEGKVHTMNDVLTRAEMESRFQGEWLLIADPEVNESLEVLRGQVVSHSAERDAVYQKGIDLRLRHSASLYIGEVPDELVLVL